MISSNCSFVTHFLIEQIMTSSHTEFTREFTDLYTFLTSTCVSFVELIVKDVFVALGLNDATE